MKKIIYLNLLMLAILAACFSGCKKHSDEKKSQHADPKTSYGQAVKSARDLKKLGAARTGDLDTQAAEAAGDN